MAESKRSIYVAIAADAGIAISKFVAGGFSGSSGMLAEGIHSVIDAGIVSLMLVGVNRSKKPPDPRHPFGHAQELYYWTNVVALLLFSLGGGMSLLEGVNRLINPHGPESPYWSYGVLAVSAALGAYSFSVSYRQLRQSQPGKGLIEAIKASKDPRAFSVFLVDTADLTGVAIAFGGILGGHILDSPYPDAIATVLIGLVLAAVAVVLANESRHLLVGESADEEIVRDIRAIAESDPTVEIAPRPFTMHLGPDDVLLALDVRFHDGLSGEEIRQAVDRMERAIQQKHPEVKRIFLEVNALDGKPSPELASNMS